MRTTADGGNLAGRHVSCRYRRHPDAKRRPIIMPAIIALVLAAIVALAIISFTLHFLFSPWLLVAIAILAWIRFRPGRSRR
jgi:hypothetical protein